MDDERRFGERAWSRLVHWLAQRDGAGALDALSDVAALRRALDRAELVAVRAARVAGSSWAEIATMLGITRQSAWEKWRELDEPGAASTGAEASRPVERDVARAGKIARRGTVTVPDVIGMRWEQAQWFLRERGLIATGADPDGPPDAIVTDQNPESGARVPAGSMVRLWLDRGGGSGVREPRRPHPEPRAGRAMRDEPCDVERLTAAFRPTDPAE